MAVGARIELLDWRRRVAELYADVRSQPDARRAWEHWREVRRSLFLEHPQSPLPPAQRAESAAPRYYDYDPAARVLADVAEGAPDAVPVPTSTGAESRVIRTGTARFRLAGEEVALDLLWLDDYAGGLLLMCRDGTSGAETYGAGRYVLDTAKGADLGMDGGRLVVDFNFAYQPSCAYDPGWACPLPPRANWLTVPIRAGERL